MQVNTRSWTGAFSFVGNLVRGGFPAPEVSSVVEEVLSFYFILVLFVFLLKKIIILQYEYNLLQVKGF